ncbi:hypothetical protein RB195_000682 [Necator americanus]|uniref:Uncharacterized protein n=1 Tax=Necator americanus TaxID=51031 RepID=A0ABR1DC80_NECAM
MAWQNLTLNGEVEDVKANGLDEVPIEELLRIHE